MKVPVFCVSVSLRDCLQRPNRGCRPVRPQRGRGCSLNGRWLQSSGIRCAKLSTPPVSLDVSRGGSRTERPWPHRADRPKRLAGAAGSLTEDRESCHVGTLLCLTTIRWAPLNQILVGKGSLNEAENLIDQVKKCKQYYWRYPERICADLNYINTKNRNFSVRNNIRLTGKRLGSPPRDPDINDSHKQQFSAAERTRNEVQKCFRSGKRKYSLDLIMARLPKGAENSISMAFWLMCAETILRLLHPFFVPIFAWLCIWQCPCSLWVELKNIWKLDADDTLVALYPSTWGTKLLINPCIRT